MLPKEKFNFQCTECGDCCRRPGVVEFDTEDFEAVLTFLGIGRRSFIENYYSTEDASSVLVWVEEGRPCPFLVDNRCSVFEVRPKQCRTYPFWTELLERNAWKDEARECPGIGQGPFYTKAEIEEIRIYNKATK